MDRVILFETTVLSAFGLARRLDLLEDRYAGRARWVDVVQAEVLAGIGSQPELGHLIGAAWLGTPLETLAVAEIERVRQRLGAGRDPRRHLGEAASIVVARREGWVLATDDREAGRIAAADGIEVVTTPVILRACVREGAISAGDASDMLAELVDRHGRRLPRLGPADLLSGP